MRDRVVVEKRKAEEDVILKKEEGRNGLDGLCSLRDLDRSEY